jgi:RNA polymerase sigma-70 factor (ECF subfamily)
MAPERQQSSPAKTGDQRLPAKIFVAKSSPASLQDDDMNCVEQDEVVGFSDEEYVESSRNGCPEHFRLLVQRYQRPLFAFLAGRLGNQTEAEEAAQESFVRAFFALKKLRKPGSFYAWLLGIAGRVLKEQFRSNARHKRDREFVESLQPEDDDSALDYPVEEAIALLPEQYRQVILLRFYEGLSCREVAARLEVPLGSVTKTLSRAYALLRQKLQKKAELTIN